jgi:hypothetical protein
LRGGTTKEGKGQIAAELSWTGWLFKGGLKVETLEQCWALCQDAAHFSALGISN